MVNFDAPSLLVAPPQFGDPRLPERFWSKCVPVPWCGCWLWIGGLKDSEHGVFWLDGRCQQAHRVSYIALVGPIDDGLELDHLCRMRMCVNPSAQHVEPVTPYVNTMRGLSPAAIAARQLTCAKGHPLTPDNIQPHASGTSRRPCRLCAGRRARESDERQRQRKG